MTAVRARLLDGFDDSTFGPAAWERLLGTDVVYLTWPWQRAWWETFGRGDLLLVLAERAGEVVALAPFYSEGGFVYFIGWGDEGDNLDFIGDVTDPEVLDAVLQTARKAAGDFQGFEFYYLPAGTGTRAHLEQAADRLGLLCGGRWEMAAPALDLREHVEAAMAAANGRHVRKRERFLQRHGSFEVEHTADGDRILRDLEAFFDQHVARFQSMPMPSAFVEEKHRTFLRRLTSLAGRTGWLRFMRIDWNGRPIGFHYGYCYRGRYFWNEPSFAPDMAGHSPGQVVLRHLLLAAVTEGAHLFDFGTVDQAFKLRVATHLNYVQGCRLSPQIEKTA